MFVGEIIASAAAFVTGSSSVAHWELYGPITPITSGSATQALALAVHFRPLKFPVCDVESSQDWYPRRKLPAR